MNTFSSLSRYVPVLINNVITRQHETQFPDFRQPAEVANLFYGRVHGSGAEAEEQKLRAENRRGTVKATAATASGLHVNHGHDVDDGDDGTASLPSLFPRVCLPLLLVLLASQPVNFELNEASVADAFRTANRFVRSFFRVAQTELMIH